MPPRRRPVDAVSPAEIATELRRQVIDGIVTGDEIKVCIGKCVWYADTARPSKTAIKTIEDFVTFVIKNKVDDRDATCFGDRYGILYSWLYIFTPAYIGESYVVDGSFGELAVRLGLLLLENDAYDKDEYTKFNDFAVKNVCIQIIKHICNARGDTMVTMEQLDELWTTFLHRPEIVPLTRLLAMAIRYTNETETVKEFAGSFTQTLSRRMTLDKHIAAFYQIGNEVYQYLVNKYNVKAIAPAPVHTIAIEPAPVPVEVPIEMPVEMPVETPMEPEKVTAQQVEAVAESILDASSTGNALVTPSTHIDGNTGCARCSGNKQPETTISFTEGRFEGRSDAAVDYISLEVDKQNMQAWYKMKDTHRDNDKDNEQRYVDFIESVLKPIKRVDADQLLNLSFTLATTENPYATGAIIRFMCVEFIEGTISGGILGAMSKLKARLERLLTEVPEFRSKRMRATLTTLLVQQVAKQMIDADESAERPLSGRYAFHYGMLKHVVAYAHAVESMLFLYETSIKKMHPVHKPLWIQRVKDDIVERVFRRFAEALYASRLYVGGARWSDWKKEYLLVYSGVYDGIVARIMNPAMHTTPHTYSELPLRAREMNKRLDETVKRIDVLPAFRVREPGAIEKFKFPAKTPVLEAEVPPSLRVNERQEVVFHPLGPGSERAAEDAILKAVSTIKDNIDRVELMHKRTDLRESFGRMLSRRAFWGDPADKPFGEVTVRDYSCGGAFSDKPIPDMQAYLASLVNMPREGDPMVVQ